MIATSFMPFHRRRPTAASHTITPMANTSARRSTRCALACSGGMYATFPLSSPVRVSSELSIAFAMPKSTTFT